MNEHININTNAVFMEVTARKMETQDKKIAAVEEKVKDVRDIAQLLQKLPASIEEVKHSVNSSAFPVEKLAELSALLEANTWLLKHPVQNKIMHHHHIPKIIWIAAGLFFAFALVCAGWYSTANKLDRYSANDTKYRSLRLDTAQKGLQAYLDYTDSIYSVRNDMRKIVLDAEEKNRVNFERLQKAERLKAEAKQLEKTVKRK